MYIANLGKNLWLSNVLAEATTPAPGSAVNLTQDQIDLILKFHNDERAKYDVVDLQWDPVIADVMDAHGERCWYAHSNDDTRDYVSLGSSLDAEGNPVPMYHTENIAASSHADGTCSDVEYVIERLFNVWNEESSYYICQDDQPIEGKTVHDYVHWAVLTDADARYIGCSMICGCEDFMIDQATKKVWPYMLFCQYTPGGYDGKRPFPLESCLSYSNESINECEGEGECNGSHALSNVKFDLLFDLLELIMFV